MRISRTISRMILMMISSRTMMMRKRRQSLRTKRKQPKIKTKGMGLQRDAALFLCNRKRAVSGAPGEGIRHVGFFMFGNVQKKLDG